MGWEQPKMFISSNEESQFLSVIDLTVAICMAVSFDQNNTLIEENSFDQNTMP